MTSSVKTSLTVALVAAATAASSLSFTAATPAAHAGESWQAAHTNCVKKLRESCVAVRVAVRGNCYVIRGVATRRVGRTWGCPGSPTYVY